MAAPKDTDRGAALGGVNSVREPATSSPPVNARSPSSALPLVALGASTGICRAGLAAIVAALPERAGVLGGSELTSGLLP